MATDEDGDDLTYSLSGTDAALFTIDPATGAVRFIAPPDFENPGDAGRNNVYDIVVTASDGPNDANQPVAITVTNVNDNTPSFTSDATASVTENRTLAYTAMATDADGDALTYSLSGTDAALFTINAATGEVRFREASRIRATWAGTMSMTSPSRRLTTSMRTRRAGDKCQQHTVLHL